MNHARPPVPVRPSGLVHCLVPSFPSFRLLPYLFIVFHHVCSVLFFCSHASRPFIVHSLSFCSFCSILQNARRVRQEAQWRARARARARAAPLRAARMPTRVRAEATRSAAYAHGGWREAECHAARVRARKMLHAGGSLSVIMPCQKRTCPGSV